MKRHRMVGALLVVTSTVSGCATILNGSKQNVSFETTPPQATARVEFQTLTTPATIKLARDQSYEVTFEKSGYLPAHAHIGHSVSCALFGNLLFGGIIGILVDVSSGAAFNLEPGVVSATLVADPNAGKVATPTSDAPSAAAP